MQLSTESLRAAGGACERCHGPYELVALARDPFRGSGAPVLQGRPPSDAISELPGGALRIDTRRRSVGSLLFALASLCSAGLLGAAGIRCVISSVAIVRAAIAPGYGPDLLDGPEIAGIAIALFALAGWGLRRVAWSLDGREHLSIESEGEGEGEGATLVRRRTALRMTFTRRVALSQLQKSCSIVTHPASRRRLLLRVHGGQPFPIASGTALGADALEWLRFRLLRLTSATLPSSRPLDGRRR